MQRYWYYVSGNKNPFATLLDALTMFPADEFGERPEWSKLPQYVRDNIRRDEVS